MTALLEPPQSRIWTPEPRRVVHPWTSREVCPVCNRRKVKCCCKEDVSSTSGSSTGTESQFSGSIVEGCTTCENFGTVTPLYMNANFGICYPSAGIFQAQVDAMVDRIVNSNPWPLRWFSCPAWGINVEAKADCESIWGRSFSSGSINLEVRYTVVGGVLVPSIPNCRFRCTGGVFGGDEDLFIVNKVGSSVGTCLDGGTISSVTSSALDGASQCHTGTVSFSP